MHRIVLGVIGVLGCGWDVGILVRLRREKEVLVRVGKSKKGFWKIAEQ